MIIRNQIIIDCGVLVWVSMLIVIVVMVQVVVVSSIINLGIEMKLFLFGCSIISMLIRLMLMVIQWCGLMCLFNSGIDSVVISSGVMKQMVQVVDSGRLCRVNMKQLIMVMFSRLCSRCRFQCIGIRECGLVVISIQISMNGSEVVLCRKVICRVGQLVESCFMFVFISEKQVIVRSIQVIVWEGECCMFMVYYCCYGWVVYVWLVRMGVLFVGVFLCFFLMLCLKLIFMS